MSGEDTRAQAMLALSLWEHSMSDPVAREAAGQAMASALTALLDENPQAASALPPPEDYHIVPLPASVHDRHGHPIGEPVTSDAMRWDAAYPLTALCSTCQQPVRCETAESPWAHE
jgi:hypothetical protein